MTEALLELHKQIKNSTETKQTKSHFLEYCYNLIALYTSEDLTEEEVGHRLLELLFTAGLYANPEFKNMYDILIRLEKPRKSTYAQPIYHWDARTADAIKEKEWEQFLEALDDLS